VTRCKHRALIYILIFLYELSVMISHDVQSMNQLRIEAEYTPKTKAK
jgi:TFIIF-interacting CTD phosphatase-like protein